MPSRFYACSPIATFSLRLQYTKNQRVQQLSPFELDVTGPLFRNVAEKIRHKVEVRSD